MILPTSAEETNETKVKRESKTQTKAERLNCICPWESPTSSLSFSFIDRTTLLRHPPLDKTYLVSLRCHDACFVFFHRFWPREWIFEKMVRPLDVRRDAWQESWRLTRWRGSWIETLICIGSKASRCLKTRPCQPRHKTSCKHANVTVVSGEGAMTVV